MPIQIPSDPNEQSVELQQVKDAAERIRTFAHRTPVIQSESLNRAANANLFFKCENLQKIGAFKFRGACNAVFQLSDQQAEKGVVTHSSGNHAQALALAAKLRGIRSWVVMPRNAPEIKRDAVIGYGATVIDCEPNQAARESAAMKIVEESSATFIHPYDHPHIIAGQGTAALELLQDVPDLDFLLAPVGGGGLISGCCVVSKELQPHPVVIAAEPEGADDAARSKQSGKRVTELTPNTIADGLLTTLGELTWPYVRDSVNEIITVSDSEIVTAMKLFWERTKLIIEPSSATVVAAVLKRTWPLNARLGLILSGGNVSLRNLPW